MSFDSSLHQAKALAQYDKYMLGEEPAFACGRGGRSYRDKMAALVWAHLWRPVTAAVLFVEAVIAVSLPAVATSRLLRYAGSRSYVTQADCIRMAWMFFACAVFSQLVLFVVGLLWKARSYFARHESGDQRDAADALAVLGDALFLALEDVPQLIMQTVFWVSGMALLPAWVYGISTALSLLGLSFGVGHVALRVRRQGGGLKWCADLAAAWRLQLIVVTGGNQ
ncbi:hypothetical protein OEZ85_014138 [Tetradesmus obliquus]|uniref:ABC transmembrane type-1 domain-containing protein n=1 Tax=Tetradesmus obliquus TaxID=3088 RepID=A0ABY8UB04_TETOB|nr:hypothetical protein OEZ85_014138 [Tetradesmus obliquus]